MSGHRKRAAERQAKFKDRAARKAEEHFEERRTAEFRENGRVRSAKLLGPSSLRSVRTVQHVGFRTQPNKERAVVVGKAHRRYLPGVAERLAYERYVAAQAELRRLVTKQAGA